MVDTFCARCGQYAGSVKAIEPGTTVLCATCSATPDRDMQLQAEANALEFAGRTDPSEWAEEIRQAWERRDQSSDEPIPFATYWACYARKLSALADMFNQA